jgi:hypothetical protein
LNATPFTVPVAAEEAAWIRERMTAFGFFEEPGLFLAEVRKIAAGL